MKRRTFLIGTGSIAIGGSALLGSGAFSRVESQRSVTVQVAEDPDAYLGLDGCPESANQSYTNIDDHGHLEVDMTPENPTDAGGQGVNSDSRTWFDDVFQVCNQGKELVCVHIQDDDDWPTYEDDEGNEERRVDFYEGGDRENSIVGAENLLVLDTGDCVCVGIRTTTKGLSDGDQLLEALGNEVTIVADVECEPEGIPEEGEGAICGEKELTDALESYIEGLEPNGEFDPDNPRAGWEIQMTPDPDLEMPWFSTTTDEDGHYCFTELPAGEYTVCEVVKPGTVPVTPEDGCHDTVVITDEEETIEGVNFENDLAEEMPEEPEPRTIGFWSNWSGDCTPGGQENVLGDTLADAGGIELGDLTVTQSGHAEPPNCGAVSLLSKRDLDGNIRANDGAYNLAAQLLAAKLNEAAGADVPGNGTGDPGDDCADVRAQIDAGQALLADIEFDGTGAYLPPGTGGRQDALDIATCLDQYNNGEFTQ